eukprot:jgi/Ulvmu1/7993/UM004_0228.1
MKMLFPGVAEHVLLRLQRTIVPQSKETLEETTYATCAYDPWGPLDSSNPGGRTNMFMPGMDCCATSSFDDFVAMIEASMAADDLLAQGCEDAAHGPPMAAMGPKWGLIWFGTQLVVIYLAFVAESGELKPRAHCFVMHQHSGSESEARNVWSFWKVLRKVAELAKRSRSLPVVDEKDKSFVFRIPDCLEPPHLVQRFGTGPHVTSSISTAFCTKRSAPEGPTMSKAGAFDWVAAVSQMQLLRLPLIHQSSHSYVGLAMGPNGSRAAVKAFFPDGSGASDTEGAETEVKVLNLLKNHQGNGIPILFAYTYVAVLYIRLPALVLQYVGARNGDDLPVDVWRSEGIKRQVRNLFNLLHEKKMTHGDPALRQLVVADGSSDSEPRLFLVDFERVTFNATNDAIKNEVEAIERMMRRPSDDSEQHQLSPGRDIGTLPL